MKELFITFLSLSLSGSIVAILIFVLKLLFKNKSSKLWQYYIWLVVILRFIVPFTPQTSVVGELFNRAESRIAMSDRADVFSDGIGNSPSQQPTGENQTYTLNSVEPPVSMDVFKTALDSLWVLWLTVAAVMLVRKIIGYQNFVARVRLGSRKVDNPKVIAIYNGVYASMGIKKPMQLYVNELCSSPMLVGILNPFIVLPETDIDDEELKYIIQHEITHYKRLDIYYKWAVQAAVCLHWFNPLVYLISREINKSCELACDESIIKQLDEHSKYAYGNTLISSIRLNTNNTKKIIFLSLNEDTNLIKERLGAIMKFKGKTKITVLMTVILTVAVVIGATLSGAYMSIQALDKTPQNTTVYSNEKLSNSSIKIDTMSLTAGGKISMGNNILDAGTKCSVLISWKGDGNLSVTSTLDTGESKIYVISNNKETSFTIEKTGEYTIAVKNEGQNASNLKGKIWFDDAKQAVSSNSKPNSSNAQTVVYDKVELRKYGDGGAFDDYIHDVKTNNTNRKIISNKLGMLAFDKTGKPLKLFWHGIDSSVKKSYSFLYDWGTEEIPANTTNDVRGGWSLNGWGNDENVAKIAYVLYCDKEITFQDGTVWKNPDYDNWIKTYEGKTIAVETLKNYYPYVMNIK